MPLSALVLPFHLPSQMPKLTFAQHVPPDICSTWLQRSLQGADRGATIQLVTREQTEKDRKSAWLHGSLALLLVALGLEEGGYFNPPLCHTRWVS